jgi:hypothetical protein
LRRSIALLRSAALRPWNRRAPPRVSPSTSANIEESTMPRGDKSSYTGKQKRMAEHIEEGYEKRGLPEKEAERRAWATVNKETGGGNKSGSGRGVPDTNVSAKKGGRIGGPRGGKAAASRPAAARSRSAKKAAATRKRNATKRSPRKAARKR